MSITVMWFRKDLRLDDNTALINAVSSLSKEDKLLCIFHLDESQFRPGSHSHDYFFEALNHFIEASKKKAFKIHLLSGDLITAFNNLKSLYPKWDSLFFNQDNRGYGKKRDLLVKNWAITNNIDIHDFNDNHLHQASDIKKEDGSYYKKFTPYYKKWRSLEIPSYQSFVANKDSFNSVNDNTHFINGDNLLTHLLTQKKRDFSKIVGEDYAIKQLNNFVLNRLSSYEKQRDFPAIKGTSRLSPDLSIGQISIRKVYQSCLLMATSGGQETFIRELAWRDFYHMIYSLYPNQYQEEIIEKYRKLPWKTDQVLFKKWTDGQTGYPIIDASMRQLNHTGWMHNRMRMLVASFLTKDLLIDWRLGAAYFSKQLIDYDSASNIGGWQWASSTGTDAAPYFRIFNPTKQGLKFDTNGEFIKEFIPELSNLPIKFIHEPHLLTLEEQNKFGVILDKDYPSPIIEHQFARKRALEWFNVHS